MNSEPLRPSILVTAPVLALASTGLAFGLQAIQQAAVVEQPLVMLGIGYALAALAGMSRSAGVTITQALALGFACFAGVLVTIATGSMGGDGAEHPLAAVAVFVLYSLLAAIVVLVASNAPGTRVGSG